MKRLVISLLTLGMAVFSALTLHAQLAPDAGERAASPAPFNIGGNGAPPATRQKDDTAPSSPDMRVGSGGEARSRTSRYLLPMGNLRLDGERNTRAWNIFLTGDEAETATGLQLAYINAVSVMPEASRLKVEINGRSVLDVAIDSSDAQRIVRVPVPAGLLRAGANTIDITAEQRHRVACTVESTYELWTDIDAARTYLTFASGARPGRLQSLDDIAAVGFDAFGETTLTIVVPSPRDSVLGEEILYLSQALAVRGRFAHPVVSITGNLPGGSRPGELVVLLAPSPQQYAATGPDAPVLPHATFRSLRDGSTALVIAGETPEEIYRRIALIVPQNIRDPSPSSTVDTASLYSPETTFSKGASKLAFGMLGVETQEFSGRRFTTSITVALPMDFYTQAYGEARLLIDAGFAVDMQPGSYFIVSVNGRTSSVLPLDMTAGKMVTQMPIRIPMHHFRPGVNTIELSGVFRTAQDADCAPGTTLQRDPRFALFDSSSLVIPDFGRMGTTPNLAAFSARGFPYWRKESTLYVYLADQESATVAAAATLLANVSFHAQRVMPVDIVPHINAIQQQNALLIGAAGKLPPVALAQTGLAFDMPSLQESADTLLPGSGTVDTDAPLSRPGINPANAEDIRERWQKRTGPEGDAPGTFAAFQQWLRSTFNLTVDAVFPRLNTPPYSPPNGTLIVLAQGHSMLGNYTWTVMTAGSAEALEVGIKELTEPVMWPQVDGKITAFRQSTYTVDVVMPAWVDFIPMHPPELFNLRMVAANWLSSNLSSYALVMLLACALLGLASYLVLIQVGRR
ncbi:cellulose biosynthesis cyclic di-GMP-binding regulatory protein BcsB [Pseudochelatococcus contaminans]|uniref:Cyclic di-GMP-binding protein n=1 Tax=Pseudochelatococcus contaminans TaxID=1538103 RepID=A0A7W5Z4X8_9HYPH|nr:cellulose biosynthesis cyclic di-GMP-binding regulatory protein BcsB [Pseudochelatococcus contaminans]MBB3810148.1 hypothetical protein [Pseudochelatococcus contaminans]